MVFFFVSRDIFLMSCGCCSTVCYWSIRPISQPSLCCKMSTRLSINEDSEKKPFQRIGRACDECRRRKVRCNGVYPSCHRCKSQSIVCHYKNPIKKRGPSKESLENRLHKMEALISTLVTENQHDSSNETVETGTSTIDQRQASPLPAAAKSPVLNDSNEIREYFPAVPLASHLQHFSYIEADSSSPSSASTSSSVDELSKNLENLAVIDRYGNLRYYGNSSGFYVFKSSPVFRHRAFDTEEHAVLNYNGKSLRNDMEGRQIQISIPIMPPPDLAEHLIDIYFKYCYTVLPVLHKETFLKRLQDPQNPPPAILMNAIFAIASRLSTDKRVYQPNELCDQTGKAFFDRVQALLDEDMDKVSTATIQSLLLIASHQYGAKKGNRSWIYTGMALRMAQSMGLNRNCDRWNISTAEKEERKRTFWCCYIVDRMSSTSYGRQLGLDDREIDVGLPSEEDNISDGSIPVVDYMRHYVKLCEISGKVLQDIYSVTINKSTVSPVEKLTKLHAMLHEWKIELPPFLQYEPQHNLSRQIPHLAICQLHMVYYNTVITLHRPYIPLSQQRIPYPSLQICISAAYSILNIAESLSSEERFKYALNYCVLCLFTCGAMFTTLSKSDDSRIALEAQTSIDRLLRLLHELDDSWGAATRFSRMFEGTTMKNYVRVNEHKSEPSATQTDAFALSTRGESTTTTYNSFQPSNTQQNVDQNSVNATTLQTSVDNQLTQSSLLGLTPSGNDVALPGIPLIDNVQWDSSFEGVPDIFQNWQNADVDFMDIVTLEGLLEM
ncbi:fungal-specific transcription factor domain-containing protein [Umbelopsis sp. PMI_123]|nr:fungal-specific transcription factor domain-containing protein [Umbelopsis sp. PMI_123]